MTKNMGLNMTCNKKRHNEGFMLMEVCIYFVIFVFLCNITFALIVNAQKSLSNTFDNAIQNYALINSAKLLTTDIMQASQNIAGQNITCSVNKIEFYISNSKISWSLVGDKLYRTQDGTKNQLCSGLSAIDFVPIKEFGVTIAIKVSLFGASKNSQSLSWTVGLINRDYAHAS